MSDLRHSPRLGRVAISCALAATAVAGRAAAEPLPHTPIPAGLMMDEVVVTAAPTDAPLTVVTDPKAPRQPIPPADGAGYLKQIPGFSIVRKGGSGGDPLLRGQGGSRLNVLLDGMPLLGGCGGRMDPPTAYVFPESYDRITVLKGPQTVLYGPGNSAGTVLFERDTKRFATLEVRGTATAILGSNGRNDQMLDAAAGMPEGYVRAIGTRSEANDYEDGDGNDVHSEYFRRSLTGAVGWTPDDTTTLEVAFDLSEGEAAYADRMMDGVAFDREGIKLKLAKQAISDVVAGVKLEAYYTYIDHVMDNFSLRPNTGMRAANNPDRETIGGRGLIELAVAPTTLLTLGVDYKQDEHTTRKLNNAEIMAGVRLRDKPRDTDMEFQNVGVFAQVEHALSPTSRILAGLRGDYLDVDHKMRALDDSERLFSGFGRYEHDLDLGIGAPVTAFAGFGHVERGADWWERNRVFDLDSEKTNQFDIGLVASGKRFRAGISLFYADYDDYILIQSAPTNTARNIDAHSLGGEIDLAYALTDSLSIYTALSYVRADNDTDDRPLGQTPPLEWRANLQYDDGTYLGGVVLRAAAEQNRVAVGQGNIAGTDIGTTDGFFTLAVNAGWRPWENVLLMAGIDNLLDASYSEHLNKRTDASMTALGYGGAGERIQEPGRTAWVRGSVSF